MLSGRGSGAPPRVSNSDQGQRQPPAGNNFSKVLGGKEGVGWRDRPKFLRGSTGRRGSDIPQHGGKQGKGTSKKPRWPYVRRVTAEGSYEKDLVWP